MSNFEDQLRALELRRPLPEWAEEIVAQCEFTEPARCATWRGWLWPSPLAWAALAAIWLGLAGWSGVERPAADRPAQVATRAAMFPLYAQQAEIEANRFWPMTATHPR
jgi:hypothetical protein